MAILTFWCDTAHAGPSLWPSSKGEICIENIDTGGFVRLAVTRIIGNHYSVSGIVTETGGTTLVNGNAEIIGDQILMNISASGYDAVDNEAHGTIGSVKLTLDSVNNELTGYYNGIGFHCEGVNDCGIQKEGPSELVSVPCL
jgi:hypothetical protein